MLNDDVAPDADLRVAQRIRGEIEALGVLLRDMRQTSSDRDSLVLLPLMFECVRSGKGPPADGLFEATDDEFRKALRGLVAALLVASFPREGLDPQIADDAQWALARFGLTRSMLLRRPDVAEITRRIDDHVANVAAVILAGELAAQGGELPSPSPRGRRAAPRHQTSRRLRGASGRSRPG